MMIDLTCPHCNAMVAAREADRGETVRCGICLKEIPVPAADPVPVAPAPVKAAILPTAKLLPASGISKPLPKPAVATPIRVMPVTPVPIPVSPVKEERPRPPKMRSVRRDEDDEDFADTTERKSKAGLLVIVSLVGLLLAGGVTIGIILLVRGSGGNDSADGSKNANKDGYVEPQPLWDPNKNPGKPAPPPANDPFPAPFNPPQIPAFQKPKEPDWIPVEKAEGFEALVPGKMPPPTEFKPLRINIDLGGHDPAKGKKYGSLTVNVFQVVFCGFEIHYVDLPAGPFDLEAAMRKMHLELRPEWPAKACTLAGQPAVEIGAGVTPRGVAPPVVQGVVIRGTKVGPRFFTAKFTYLIPDQAPKWPQYRDKFFENFKITFDLNTPAPSLPAKPGESGVPASPFLPPAVAPANPTAGAPYVVAKLQPFWGAVFLPDRNEVLTVGPRLLANLGRGGGVLRRYSLPDFKLKGTYPMPRAATRAVYDIATSTLFCTTLAGTRADNTIRDSERVVAFGDIEAYDLGPVFKGTATEKDELKPTFTVPLSSYKLTGLDLSPDGKWLYAVRTTQLGTPAKPRGWKASLVRIDIAQRKILDPIDLPTPVLQMKLAPDGQTIYLAEIQFSDFGGEILGAGQTGKVDAVDVSAWRLKHNIVFGGPVLDMVVAKDNSHLVCGVQGKVGSGLASAIASGSEVIAFDPPTEPSRVAGYVSVSPNGSRIVTAARSAEGIDVYEVQDLGRKDGLKLLARGKEAAGTTARTPLGGHFYLSPDGRFALFQVGAVIDIVNPMKKPE